MKTTNYIFPTHQSDPNADTNIDFAVVHIDDHARQRLTHFKRIRDQADQALTEGAHPELVWFNYWASYDGFYNDPISEDFEYESLADRLDQALADSTIMEATDEELNHFKEAGSQRTEMDEIHICWDGVYWTCTPKYLDTMIRTELLTWEQLGI